LTLRRKAISFVNCQDDMLWEDKPLWVLAEVDEANDPEKVGNRASLTIRRLVH